MNDPMSTPTSFRSRCIRIAAAVTATTGLLAACGGGSGTAAPTTSTTTSTTTTTTTLDPVTWSSQDEILELAPQQALPAAEAVTAWANSENERLGGSDGIVHRDSAIGIAGPLPGDGCSQAGSVSTAYSSDLPLTEEPTVGILTGFVSVEVCTSADAVDALDAENIGLVDGDGRELLDGGFIQCPIDRRGDEPAVLFCERRVGDSFSTLAIAHRDRVVVWAFVDVGAETDPEDAVGSVTALLDLALVEIDRRLATP